MLIIENQIEKAIFLTFFAFFDDFVEFFVFEGVFASFQDPSGAFDGLANVCQPISKKAAFWRLFDFLRVYA